LNIPAFQFFAVVVILVIVVVVEVEVVTVLQSMLDFIGNIFF